MICMHVQQGRPHFVIDYAQIAESPSPNFVFFLTRRFCSQMGLRGVFKKFTLAAPYLCFLATSSHRITYRFFHTIFPATTSMHRWHPEIA